MSHFIENELHQSPKQEWIIKINGTNKFYEFDWHSHLKWLFNVLQRKKTID